MIVPPSSATRSASQSGRHGMSAIGVVKVQPSVYPAGTSWVTPARELPPATRARAAAARAPQCPEASGPRTPGRCSERVEDRVDVRDQAST